MYHEDIVETFQMNDGATLTIENSRHSEFSAAFIPGETNTVVTCSVHGKLGESYEPMLLGWDAEAHAGDKHGGLTSRTPISKVTK
jgi:hypothetical protein